MSRSLNSVRAQVEILRHVKARKAELKELEETARAAVEEALGDDEDGTLDGVTVVTWKHIKARRLNQKALREHHPELVESYTQANEYRRFEVVDD